MFFYTVACSKEAWNGQIGHTHLDLIDRLLHHYWFGSVYLLCNSHLNQESIRLMRGFRVMFRMGDI